MENAKRKAKNSKLGFTLIEMIVAVGIFSAVMLISVGAILSIHNAQRRAIAMQNVQDNLRFAVETIAKEARTGTSFHCDFDIGDRFAPRRCPEGADSFVFLNARNETVAYRVQGTQIERGEYDPGTGAFDFFPITAQNVTIDRFIFYVIGTNDPPSFTPDGFQPRITVIVGGRAEVKNQSIRLDLQTTISQRLLDS